MADAMKFKILGDKELQRGLKQFEDKVAKKIVRRATKKVAQPVHQAAVQLAPKKTGMLKGAISIRAFKKKDKFGTKITIGKRLFVGDQFYGAFVELGTKKMAAQPFLRPALEKNRGRVRETLKGILKREMEIEARRIAKRKAKAARA